MICEGIAAQKKIDELGITVKPVMTVAEMEKTTGSGDPSKELHEWYGDEIVAFDDLTGDKLDPKMMSQARREEIKYFRSMGVYEKVKVDESWSVTGKGPIAVRWVDINKGDSRVPNYRSRRVAKEFNTGVNHDLYAATPPSECLRLMLSILASGRKAGTSLMYADVSRAYFYAPAERPVYVQLPEEDQLPGDEGKCGRLKMSMYGTRDAALNLSKEYGKTLCNSGFIQGRSNPCLFRHDGMGVSIMVHGDDFIAVGPKDNLKATKDILENKYKLKVEVLGMGKDESPEVIVLNKIVRMREAGI